MENQQRLLFLDIETASGQENFDHLTQNMQQEWVRKASGKWREEAGENPAAIYASYAGILAEFGRIVCISIGWLDATNSDLLHIRSFAGRDEHKLLNDFCHAVGGFVGKRGEAVLVGHNIKEFDIPYIGRRMLIHGMSLPDCLKIQGKKPWEIPHQDTMELWRFGDIKAFIRLSLLCEVLQVPTSKDDISGEQVSEVFWQQKDVPRIAKYCEKDVLATARVFFHLNGMFKEAHALIDAREKAAD